MVDWISVNDKMPQYNGKFKIKGLVGSLTRTPFEAISIYHIYEKRGDGRFLYGFDWTTITHWKPLYEE